MQTIKVTENNLDIAVTTEQFLPDFSYLCLTGPDPFVVNKQAEKIAEGKNIFDTGPDGAIVKALITAE